MNVAIEQSLYAEFDRSSLLAQYRQHAILCGIDMTGREAVPVRECEDRELAVDALDPVTLEPLLSAGITPNLLGMHILLEAGIDYVVVVAAH